ncbi:Protein of unknown function [Lactobacillus helveticus CIRM-BIA 104]|uniref:Uncharacterized protein n=2 Tax=Lactobacillus helveticus TaxID=1587 RepID=U4QMP6_LACHE|nr:Protein of unknown function [Lactobacillus helveticus CIRM-BIA 953]CDI61308.1 Protein of unknown function [Lactobacillus helveticus CIRM-BIA 104]
MSFLTILILGKRV